MQLMGACHEKRQPLVSYHRAHLCIPPACYLNLATETPSMRLGKP